MNIPRDSHAICYLNGYLYVVGGITIDEDGNKVVTKKCEKYNLAGDFWMEIKDAYMPVSNHCICTYNNKYIYSFGGRAQSGKLTNIIMKYSIENNSWTKLMLAKNGRLKFSLNSQASCCQINDD